LALHGLLDDTKRGLGTAPTLDLLILAGKKRPSPPPADQRHILCCIKHLQRSCLEAVLHEHVLRRLSRHARENRSPSRQHEFTCPRKVEGIESDLQEEAEHARAAADCSLSCRHSDLVACLF